MNANLTRFAACALYAVIILIVTSGQACAQDLPMGDFVDSQRRFSCVRKDSDDPDVDKFLSLAVRGGAWGGSFCLKTLIPTDDPEYLIPVVTSLAGEEIYRFDPLPLMIEEAIEDCYPTILGVDDLNSDDIPDFLYMVMCVNTDYDSPANFNKAYISKVTEGPIIWLSDKKVDKAISFWPTFDGARSAARTVLAGYEQPRFGMRPAGVQNCRYSSPWGEIVLQLNYDSGAVSGTFNGQSGTIKGSTQSGIVAANWSRSDGAQGAMEFVLTRQGFEGMWRNSVDDVWVDALKGELIECFGGN